MCVPMVSLSRTQYGLFNGIESDSFLKVSQDSVLNEEQIFSDNACMVTFTVYQTYFRFYSYLHCVTLFIFADLFFQSWGFSHHLQIYNQLTDNRVDTCDIISPTKEQFTFMTGQTSTPFSSANLTIYGNYIVISNPISCEDRPVLVVINSSGKRIGESPCAPFCQEVAQCELDYITSWQTEEYHYQCVCTSPGKCQDIALIMDSEFIRDITLCHAEVFYE